MRGAGLSAPTLGHSPHYPSFWCLGLLCHVPPKKAVNKLRANISPFLLLYLWATNYVSLHLAFKLNFPPSVLQNSTIWERLDINQGYKVKRLRLQISWFHHCTRMKPVVSAPLPSSSGLFSSICFLPQQHIPAPFNSIPWFFLGQARAFSGKSSLIAKPPGNNGTLRFQTKGENWCLLMLSKSDQRPGHPEKVNSLVWT